MTAKPRLAIFDFACCEGCQLQIVNMEETLLDLLQWVDPVEWREAMSDQSDSYDIAIIEGSVMRESDRARVREIRDRAKIVIALGACATMGGVNKLINNTNLEESRRYVYGDRADQPHLATDPVQSIEEVIKVDYKIEGCPIDAEELAHVVKSILLGKEPEIPTYPVCVECKMKENCCRFEYDEICLGPLTRAGCDARCPSNGFWCFGCRGLVPDANVNAAKDVMREYGKTVADLEQKLTLFGSK